MTDAVDLVCGPASPRPGSEHSYRLTRRLGAGGQAEVFQAVRLSAGVSSTTLTVKVFKLHPGADREQQYNSWDKGDAVLMDLGGRSVPAICRRIDAFYGPAPHRYGDQPPAGEPVPYQVLEYLPGYDLSQLILERRGRVDAVATLQNVSDVLHHLHRPRMPGAHPVLHMDIKPANIIIDPDGSSKLIDFTGARYYTPAHLTTISYTRETAGPEAYQGKVGPSYDVHGFGSVAYFLVTGASARTDAPSDDSVPWSQLRRHPLLESNPRLREHLLAPLADDPADRPMTTDLPAWIDGLAQLVTSSPVPDLGADWGGANVPAAAAATAVMSGRVPEAAGAAAPPRPPATTYGGGAAAGANRPISSAPVSATPISGSAAVSAPQSAPSGAGGPDSTRLIDPSTVGAPHVVSGSPGPGGSPPPTTQAPPVSNFSSPAQDPSPPPANGNGFASGRASYSPERQQVDQGSPDFHAQQEDDSAPLLGPPGSLMKGSELTIIGMLFAFVAWGIWALELNDNIAANSFLFIFVALLGLGVFFLARIVGGFIWGRIFGARRRTARLAHLAAGSFLAVVAFSWIGQVSLFTDVGDMLGDFF